MQADRGSALARVPEGVRRRLLAEALQQVAEGTGLGQRYGDAWLARAECADTWLGVAEDRAERAAADWLAGLEAMALVPKRGPLCIQPPALFGQTPWAWLLG